MGNRMVTLHLKPSGTDIASVRAKYSLGAYDLDASFGVVCVSPEQQLYAILVSEEAAARIEHSQGVGGVFSNPKIEPFGPPE